MRHCYGAATMARHQQLPLRHAIGARLRELRQAARITSQEALANRAGVDRTYVGRIARGETGITLDMLATLLAAMSVSLGEFFRPFHRPLQTRTPRRRD